MVQDRRQAPYAPPANVLAVIHRYRERNLPPEIDAPLLLELGVSKGNLHRTLAALRFLGLISEAGVPTPAFESLQMASLEEYQIIFSGLVRNAYEEAFRVLDPSKDAQFVIDNHFRRYLPHSQRARMVTLFLALCREAGVPTIEAPRRRGMKHQADAASTRNQGALAVRPEAARGREASSALVATFQADVSRLRKEYIMALIEKVKHEDAVDDGLLDRIERLLSAEQEEAGLPASEGGRAE